MQRLRKSHARSSELSLGSLRLMPRRLEVLDLLKTMKNQLLTQLDREMQQPMVQAVRSLKIKKHSKHLS